ncbi:ImmA/IrrE family metallo-endopeptidase [Salibacterium lacus]|uniref:ImmA/IrrE family metallo-endopeptidase n=1 Tax=Salibacterium lacus TaxID=1898109 RepID=A0ABW5T191_9BACI
MDIKGKVNALIQKHETSCPFKIAAAKGIHVIQENLGSNLGYYNKIFRIPMIHIHESAAEAQKKFICAHELGHAVCHPNSNTPFLKAHTLFSTSKIEKEANSFAVELLFSDEGASPILTVQEAVEEYKIPEQILKEVGS